MPTYSLSLSIHVKTDSAADGSAGVEVPKFYCDLVTACRYQEIELPSDERAREAELPLRIDEIIQRMPDRLRRGFAVVLAAGPGLDAPENSRWDSVLKIWIPIPDGLAVVLQLVQTTDAVHATFPFNRAQGTGAARFHLAVEARAVS